MPYILILLLGIVVAIGFLIRSARRQLMAISDLQSAVSTNTSLTTQAVDLIKQLQTGSIPEATIDALTTQVTANNSALQAALPTPAPATGTTSTVAPATPASSP